MRGFSVPSLFLLISTPLLAQTGINLTWLPVTDAERAQKAPVVDKDAGAEALFWQVHIMDNVLGGEELQRIYFHYVRLRVFTEKGKAQINSVDIPFDNKTSVEYITGRTIKSDGSEVELSKDSITVRDIDRLGGRKQRVKSFTMPGVEPGAIVEFRWKEIHSDPRTLYTRLEFQRAYPVQKVTYWLKPLSRDYTSYTTAVRPFHCKPSSPKLERDGFSSISLENVPAYQEEPMMPGDPNVRQWALIFYRDGKPREPQKYWNETGKELYNAAFKPALHINDEVKHAAQTTVIGADSDEKKMIALIRDLRSHVRDLYGPDVTAAERARILKSMPKDRLRTAVEAYKSGAGNATELNVVLAAMASQVGLEARPALVGDRDDLIFDPPLADDYFLDNVDTAVKIGDKWRLYDITQRTLPAGMLSSTEEGMPSLIGDPKAPFFVNAEVSAPELSRVTGTATLTLSEDGSLEGDAVEMFSGHLAAEQRLGMNSDSEAQRVEHTKENLTKRFAGSEISNLKIADFENTENPLRISYHIKIEVYGTRTGKRILFQPLPFERNTPPVFTAADRVYPIIFPHAWSESDDVTIALPTGFVLDSAQNLPPISFGQTGSYSMTMGLSPKHELVSRRQLTFGAGQLISFPKDSYPTLKKIFDEVHNRDSETIAMKPAESK